MPPKDSGRYLVVQINIARPFLPLHQTFFHLSLQTMPRHFHGDLFSLGKVFDCHHVPRPLDWQGQIASSLLRIMLSAV